MLTNKPPVLTRQIDRCDVCGNKHQKSNLVRTQVEYLDEAGENYFVYSSYDGTHWVCDASDAGSISAGVRCDDVRYRVNDDNTRTLVNGVQTWEGNGTFRQTSDAIDGTGSYSLVSAHVGPQEYNSSPSMTVKMGFCDSDGNNKNLVKTWTINTATRVWLNIDYATVAAYGAGENFVYFEVTNAGNWWIDELQYETVSSATQKPGNFRRTSGATNVLTTDTPSLATRKVCPSCFEVVLRKSEKYGRKSEKPVEDPITVVGQEF